MNNFIRRIPLQKLLTVSLVGGFGVIGANTYMRRSISTSLANCSYYQDAVNLMKQSNGARHLLGEPMIDQGDDQVKIRIPVRGPKGKGGLLVEAAINEEQTAWILKSVKLELNKTKELLPDSYQGKKLYIYDMDRHGPLKYENKVPLIDEQSAKD